VLHSLRRGARSAVEGALRRNARVVKKVLLATGRDEAPLPEIVQIESTNICNAKCVFCPRDDMERRQGIMDMALFTKVVDECAELGIEHVRMHNYGEPFVDRQLVDKVRYAKQRGIPQVGMISNGSLIWTPSTSVSMPRARRRSSGHAWGSSTTRSSATSNACSPCARPPAPTGRS
jgi:hypothetical protein